MHTSVAAWFPLLISIVLAAPTILINPDVEDSYIPSEVLYYYQYNHIPLSVYVKGMINEILFGEDQDTVTRDIMDMTCGPNELHVCSLEEWYCNPEVGKCRRKEVIGEGCHNDNSCFSGLCDLSTAKCAKSQGQFGSKCTDDSHCNSGLVCRYGLYNRDHKECLDKVERFYGVACSDNNDCDNPLVCNKVTVGGGRNICSMPEDLTGSVTCITDGELCGGDEQCCSSRCQVRATSRMPRCVM